jgi:hypothetical protein
VSSLASIRWSAAAMSAKKPRPLAKNEEREEGRAPAFACGESMGQPAFKLSHEPMDEPLQLLEQEAKAAGIEDRVLVLEEGVTRFF